MMEELDAEFPEFGFSEEPEAVTSEPGLDAVTTTPTAVTNVNAVVDERVCDLFQFVILLLSLSLNDTLG